MIATLDSPEAAEPLTFELASLAERKTRLSAERQAVLVRAEEWQRAEGRLLSIQEWVGKLSNLVDTLDYATRRLALDALRISVMVYGADETPRYVITAALPLPAPGASPSVPSDLDAIVSPSSRE